jgi:hypothetical protein
MQQIPNVDQLMKDMIGAVSGIANKDLSVVKGLWKSQVEKIAQQTVWFAEADKMRMFKNNKPLRDHFLKGIDDVARLCAQTLQAIIVVTVEKIWNTLVDTVWTALGKAVGFALPRPIF